MLKQRVDHNMYMYIYYFVDWRLVKSEGTSVLCTHKSLIRLFTHVAGDKEARHMEDHEPIYKAFLLSARENLHKECSSKIQSVSSPTVSATVLCSASLSISLS